MKKNYISFILSVVVLCAVLVLTIGCKNAEEPGTNHTPEPSPQPSYSDKIEEKPTDFSVTVSRGEGYKIVSPKGVSIGETLEFTVEFDENFDTAGAKVTVNGKELSSDNGIFSVADVSENLNIAVSNLVRKSYSVMLIPADGALVIGDTSVNVGADYSFSVTLEDGATKTDSFSVKVNGNEVTSDDGNYTVTDVSSDLVITVSGVSIPSFTVTDSTAGDAYELLYVGNTVIKGKDFVFSVNVNSAYEKSDEFSVSVNGETVIDVNGVYTVKNVQSDLRVQVSGLVQRGKFTVNYVNCDLEPTTEYVGSLFNLPTPTRVNYLFAGWKDKDGNDFVMDYSGDITVYASWYTNSKVDYFERCAELAESISTKYTELLAQNRLEYLNVNDYSMYEEYKEMYACFTEYERTLYTESAEVSAFNVLAVDIPHDKLAETTTVITNTCIINGEENLVVGMRDQLSIINGGDYDGSRYYMQYPKENHSLEYIFKITGVNFKKYCGNSEGRVSFYVKTNYAQMSIFYGETALAYTSDSGSIHRIDIQDGFLYYDGICRIKLSDEVYDGTQPLVLTVNKLASHEFAEIQISHIYGGTYLSGYSTDAGDTGYLNAKDNILSNANSSAEASAAPVALLANGVEKIYTFNVTSWTHAALDDFDISSYDSVKFYVKSAGINIYDGTDGSNAVAYSDTLTEWSEIKLVKNSSGVFEIYINGAKKSVTLSKELSNLNALAFNGTEGTVEYSNLIVSK